MKTAASAHFRNWFPLIAVALIGQGLAVQNESFGAATIPKRDPIDQSFRRAPMAESSRSIVIPLATNLHLAFDAHLFRTHTVWSGPGLNLKGPPYTGEKSPFICDFDGERLWGNPPIFPWHIGKREERDRFDRPENARFKGVSTKGGAVSLTYELLTEQGKPVLIRETPRREMLENLSAVVRRFEISPCDRELSYLALAVLNQSWLPGDMKSAMTIQTGSDFLTLVLRGDSLQEWWPSRQEVDYSILLQVEKDGKGPDSAVKTKRVVGLESRAWLRIPPHAEELSFEVVTVNSPAQFPPETLAKIAGNFVPASRSSPAENLPKENSLVPPVKVVSGAPESSRKQAGDEFYRIERFPLPREIDLLVGGMDWLSNGDLVICTWPGEVYVVQNAQGPVGKATYRRFARGLNEPLGIKVINDRIYVAQKSELTRLIDTDSNGEADRYETINDNWGFTGNYHSYAFGPLVDRDNNFYLFLTGQRGRWDVPYAGWCVKISPDGSEREGFCSGLRAPNGWATFGQDRDVFVTDNQGEWIGTSKLNHLQRGKFYGFPSGFPAPQAEYTRPKHFQSPAVWFPRTLAPSASDIEVITDGRFGPFEGQMLVGDFQNSLLMRVALERVKGEWQGAVWPFAKGFSGAVNRLSMGPDGKLYVGGCKRAWSTSAPMEYSLERVSFDGKTPFEVKEVRARPQGLELIFTQPVNGALAADRENYELRQFTYRYHSAYGSPEIDWDGKENSSSPVEISRVDVSPDRLRVEFRGKDWQRGYVTAVRIQGVTSADGENLWHDTFYYTLSNVPD